MSTLMQTSSTASYQGIASAGDEKENQFLTFLLGQEEYGVDILRVQEIRGWERATPIPNSPDYIRGVINLRGAVIPTIDLRRRFQKQSIPDTLTTVVIVVKVYADKKKEKIIGLVVDAVSDVRNASDDELRPAPETGLGEKRFVKGLATINNDMIILLDLDSLAETSDMESATK